MFLAAPIGKSGKNAVMLMYLASCAVGRPKTFYPRNAAAPPARPTGI